MSKYWDVCAGVGHIAISSLVGLVLLAALNWSIQYPVR